MQILPAERGAVVIVPEGRLDAAGAVPLQAEFQRQFSLGKFKLVVDLGRTRYISSNGLRALLTARKEAARQGGNLCLASLSVRLREIIEMAGFDQVFDIYSSTGQALQSFPTSDL